MVVAVDDGDGDEQLAVVLVAVVYDQLFGARDQVFGRFYNS